MVENENVKIQLIVPLTKIWDSLDEFPEKITIKDNIRFWVNCLQQYLKESDPSIKKILLDQAKNIDFDSFHEDDVALSTAYLYKSSNTSASLSLDSSSSVSSSCDINMDAGLISAGYNFNYQNGTLHIENYNGNYLCKNLRGAGKSINFTPLIKRFGQINIIAKDCGESLKFIFNKNKNKELTFTFDSKSKSWRSMVD